MSDEPIRTLIRDLENQRYAAMLDGDLDALDRLLSPRLCYTHSNAERDTKDSYLQKVRDGVFVYLAIEHPVERIDVLGGAALVIGRMRARARLAGKPIAIDNSALAVWEHTDGVWTLIDYQPTPLETT